MRLIDRYVLAVTEHLPVHMQEDVSKELTANIEDMLSENPTLEEEREVIEKLGNPKILAREYNGSKRYLIGPELYDTYIMVLKLVSTIVAVVVGAGIFIGTIVDPMVDGNVVSIAAESIGKVVGTTFNVVLQAMFWVTISFVINERMQGDEKGFSFLNQKWSIDDLPTKPRSEKRKISRGESIFSMACTIVFTTIFWVRPELIGMYIKMDSGQMELTSLFHVERLRVYFVFIILLAVVEVIIFTWQMIGGYWTIPLAIGNTIHNIAACILVIIMFSDKSLINNEFITKISGHIDVTFHSVAKAGTNLAIVFMLFFVAISIWDSLDGLLKCRK